MAKKTIKAVALEIGAKAPPFTLLSDSGEEVSLKDLKGKMVILYFYPKDSTPGCTTEACDFRDSAAKLKKLNAVVLGKYIHGAGGQFQRQTLAGKSQAPVETARLERYQVPVKPAGVLTAETNLISPTVAHLDFFWTASGTLS